VTAVLALFVQGISLGFTAAVSPGPFVAYIIAETLAFGWRHSLRLIFAPFVSDLPVAILSLLVLNQMPPVGLKIIQVVGGLLILYLAWGTLRRLRQKTAIKLVSDDVLPTRNAFPRAVLMNFLTPGLWIFWTTINAPIVLEAWRSSPPSAVAYLVGFYGLLIGGMGAWVGLFHQARRFDEQVVRGLLAISAVIMAIFGVILLRTALVG
jgi:threonine/homoserine/homoserine lactone efflux protein